MSGRSSTRRVTTLLATFALPLVLAESASAGIPNPVDVPGAIWDGATGVVSDAAGGIAQSSVEALTKWAASGAGWVAERAFAALNQNPHVDAAWFSASYARMAAVGLMLTAPALLLGLVQAALRGGQGLSRVALALPVSVLVTGAGIGVTQLLLASTDELCGLLLAGSGQDAAAFGKELATLLAAPSPEGGFVIFLVSVVTALCGLCVWIELLIRSALVYALVGFLPLAAALTVWPSALGVCRRLVRLLLAVIASKLVIAGVVSVALAAISGNPDGGFTELLVGCGMLVIACCSPLIVLRLIPLAEEAVAVRSTLSAGSAMRSGVQAVGMSNTVSAGVRGASAAGRGGAGSVRALRVDGGAA